MLRYAKPHFKINIDLVDKIIMRLNFKWSNGKQTLKNCLESTILFQNDTKIKQPLSTAITAGLLVYCFLIFVNSRWYSRGTG